MKRRRGAESYGKSKAKAALNGGVAPKGAIMAAKAKQSNGNANEIEENM